MTEERQLVIEGIHAFADFLALHPDAPIQTNFCFQSRKRVLGELSGRV